MIEALRGVPSIFQPDPVEPRPPREAHSLDQFDAYTSHKVFAAGRRGGGGGKGKKDGRQAQVGAGQLDLFKSEAPVIPGALEQSVNGTPPSDPTTAYYQEVFPPLKPGDPPSYAVQVWRAFLLEVWPGRKRRKRRMRT